MKVTVVATEELKVGDELLRFEVEIPQDDTHGSRSISARPVFGKCCYVWDASNLYPMLFFFFFFSPSLVHVCVCVCVCVMDLCCFPSDVYYSLYGNTFLLVAGL